MSSTHLPFITAMHADAALMATMGGTRDATASRRYVEHNMLHWAEHGYGMYVLSERDSGALAGRAGLKLALSGKIERIEIAYAFMPTCWGRGYASEITRALLALGFERLPVDALSAVAIQANAASLRVMENAGCAGSRPPAKGRRASCATRSGASNGGRWRTRRRRSALTCGHESREYPDTPNTTPSVDDDPPPVPPEAPRPRNAATAAVSPASMTPTTKPWTNTAPRSRRGGRGMARRVGARAT